MDGSLKQNRSLIHHVFAKIHHHNNNMNSNLGQYYLLFSIIETVCKMHSALHDCRDQFSSQTEDKFKWETTDCLTMILTKRGWA